MTSVETITVSGRDRAVLRAVAAGRCQLGAGCESLLIVDGLACTDSSVGRRLVAAGFIAAPVRTRPLGPAVITEAGLSVVAQLSA